MLKKRKMFIMCLLMVLFLAPILNAVVEMPKIAATVTTTQPTTTAPTTLTTPTDVIIEEVEAETKAGTESVVISETQQPVVTTGSVIEPVTGTAVTHAYANKYMYVRTAKNKNSEKIFLLSPGDKVKILKNNKKWAKVKNKLGTGYVLNKNLSKKRKEAIKIASKNGNIFRITGYCSCTGCSEGWGTMTKSGRIAVANHTIAADLTELPLYTSVYIEGLGIYTVEDIGGGVKGKHIDIYCNTHEECYNITRTAKVVVIE